MIARLVPTMSNAMSVAFSSTPPSKLFVRQASTAPPQVKRLLATQATSANRTSRLKRSVLMAISNPTCSSLSVWSAPKASTVLMMLVRQSRLRPLSATRVTIAPSDRSHPRRATLNSTGLSTVRLRRLTVCRAKQANSVRTQQRSPQQMTVIRATTAQQVAISISAQLVPTVTQLQRHIPTVLLVLTTMITRTQLQAHHFYASHVS